MKGIEIPKQKIWELLYYSLNVTKFMDSGEYMRAPCWKCDPDLVLALLRRMGFKSKRVMKAFNSNLEVRSGK